VSEVRLGRDLLDGHPSVGNAGDRELPVRELDVIWVGLQLVGGDLLRLVHHLPSAHHERTPADRGRP